MSAMLRDRHPLRGLNVGPVCRNEDIMAANPQTPSWHDRARTLDIRTRAFIDGNYVDAASGATFDSINPGTGKLLARIAAGDTEDVNRAVAAARAAFRKGVWANQAPKDRQ